jgi:hypothetical protein
VPSPFAFDREWRFAVTTEELWATLARTDRYPEWWPWLRELDVEGEPLTAGSVAGLVIQAPLPYQLHCTVTVEDAVAERSLSARVAGDLAGPARLELRPGGGSADGSGSVARLTWTLEVEAPLLRVFARVGRPAMSWAHDRIVERGLREFEGHALEGREPRA